MRSAIHKRLTREPDSPRAPAPSRSPVQMRSAAAPSARHDIADIPIADVTQRHAANRTGLPDALKAGIETLSDMSMDAVRVHYGSPEPARIGALAHARGTDIHLGPGQERHLPHEAWHVVQQAQGRVRPTMQLRQGAIINDESSLEQEAEAMGGRALRSGGSPVPAPPSSPGLPRPRSPAVLQGYWSGFSEEAVGTGEQLRTQSPAPEIQPADRTTLPPTPDRIAYARQQTASGSARFRVADDISMAVQATRDEPKEFFAKNQVFNASNATLEAAGSPLRLKKAGGQVRFGATTLAKIMPKPAQGPDDAEFADLWSHICIELTNYIMGNQGSQTEDVVLQSEGAEEASATITAGGLGSPGIDRLAEHLSDAAPQPDDAQATIKAALGTIKPEKLDDRPGRAYGLASAGGGLSGKAARLGVNEFASPEVGEGFATFSIFAQGKTKDGKAAVDYTTGRPRSREGQDIWGYHHAAVAARSLDGKDWMTLENYNRSPQINDKVYQYLEEKYSRVARKKRNELRLAGKTNAEITQELQYFLSAQHAGARNDYQKIFRDSNITGAALWFFRMYGSKPGQSFHEQQAASGAYVNPLTVRVRKNVVGQHLTKLQANERLIVNSIAAARIRWSPARAALNTLDTATTQAFGAMQLVLDGLKDQRDDSQLTLGLQQVNALYTAWLNNDFVPRMADALHAIKRGTLGAKPTTLPALKAQAGSPETQGKLYGIGSGIGDYLNDWNYFSSNASADRITSLTNLRAAIDNVPNKAV